MTQTQIVVLMCISVSLIGFGGALSSCQQTDMIKRIEVRIEALEKAAK